MNGFQLSTDLLQELAGVLKAAGIEASGKLSLKQYLSLRQQNSGFVTVTEAAAGHRSCSARRCPCPQPQWAWRERYILISRPVSTG